MFFCPFGTLPKDAVHLLPAPTVYYPHSVSHFCSLSCIFDPCVKILLKLLTYREKWCIIEALN